MAVTRGLANIEHGGHAWFSQYRTNEAIVFRSGCARSKNSPHPDKVKK